MAALLVSAGLLGFGLQPAEARMVPQSLAELSARLSPAVVNISTTQTVTGTKEDSDEGDLDEPGNQGDENNGGDGDGDSANPFGQPVPEAPVPPGVPQKVQSLGSGFVVDPSGIILTNNHVIEGADKIDVTFADGTTLPAKLKGRDEKTDIAVLKVESKTPLAYVKLGDSEKLRVGDWVMAIGNPFGLGGTVTAGIVSALNRDIHAGNYDDFIQTDAAINRGNSGGPLFALNGEVIGMNTAIISPSGESVGIGFATPSSTIAPVLAQILEHGEMRRGWIGVRIQSVTSDIAASLGLSQAHGALIAGVTPGGPGEKAGLETGDLVTGFDGHPVREMRDLPRIVAETEIGKEASIEVLRAGKVKNLTVKVGHLAETDTKAKTKEKPAAKPPVAKKTKVLGLDLVSVTPDMREHFKLGADVEGVLVLEVDPVSAAADKGIEPGDVIIRVGQSNVKTPKEVVAAVDAEKKAGRSSVLLRMLSGSAPRFVALPVK
ncbi:DegQ family serine endoprotease [Parvibaculum sedimenti]|uniref:DegQ family serine endoprotease n=1 Tax=Parvibaculum sedimenti TaxID=2608632 RepID=UPI001FE6AD84|nr:DegQ family serine endoprotease [Parvibaculum sedimenti]